MTIKPFTRWAAGVFILITLVSCSTGGATTPTQPLVETRAPAINPQPAAEEYPTPPPAVPEAYPSPQAAEAGGASSAYPPAGEAGAPNAWAPQPGDASLQRAEAQVEKKSVMMTKSMPPQFILNLEGTLPTPCHQLRVEVPAPTAENRIEVLVYSLVDPSMMCAQVLEPFDARLPLTGLTTGKYIVLVNGEQAGDIAVP